jgi:hypothetical protein
MVKGGSILKPKMVKSGKETVEVPYTPILAKELHDKHKINIDWTDAGKSEEQKSKSTVTPITPEQEKSLSRPSTKVKTPEGEMTVAQLKKVKGLTDDQIRKAVDGGDITFDVSKKTDPELESGESLDVLQDNEKRMTESLDKMIRSDPRKGKPKDSKEFEEYTTDKIHLQDDLSNLRDRIIRIGRRQDKNKK